MFGCCFEEHFCSHVDDCIFIFYFTLGFYLCNLHHAFYLSSIYFVPSRYVEPVAVITGTCIPFVSILRYSKFLTSIFFHSSCQNVEWFNCPFCLGINNTIWQVETVDRGNFSEKEFHLCLMSILWHRSKIL